MMAARHEGRHGLRDATIILRSYFSKGFSSICLTRTQVIIRQAFYQRILNKGQIYLPFVTYQFMPNLSPLMPVGDFFLARSCYYQGIITNILSNDRACGNGDVFSQGNRGN